MEVREIQDQRVHLVWLDPLETLGPKGLWDQMGQLEKQDCPE